MPPVTGRVIAGRYVLGQPIGRGAMGVVWRGRDQLLDREVAVKEVMLSSAMGIDERANAYQRTLREARTAARLSHRGVVTIYDVAEEDGRPWIVMELVPSRSLDEILTAEGRLTPLRAGRIGQQLLAALAAAHAVGVLHRDVKPSNVLIGTERPDGDWDERAVLTDFGIAQFEGDPRLTQTGMVMGSPGFTAPERIRGGAATPASDLWSLGATIYAAVEGRGPFEERGGAITTMSAIINEDAPHAARSGRLAPLIAALLCREPSARPSAAAAARMFYNVLPQLPGAAPEPPHPATVLSAVRTDSGADADGAAGGAARVNSAAGDGPDADEGAAAAAALAGADAADVAASGVAVDDPAPAETAAPPARTPGAGQPLDAESRSAQPPAAESPAAGAMSAGPEALAAVTSIDPVLGSLAPPAAGRPTPTFSAAPTAPPARTDPATRRSPLHETPGYGGSDKRWGAGPPWEPAVPREPSGLRGPRGQRDSGARDGPNAQYPEPNPPYAGAPDPVRQYAPGAGGRAGRRPRGRAIALTAAAVVVAAVVGGGAALALRNSGAGSATTSNTVKSSPKTAFGSVNALNNPSTARPSGWTSDTVQPSAAGTTAGFAIDVPPGWTAHRAGPTAYVDGPGGMLFEVDLRTHTYQNMVTEAKYIRQQSLAKDAFPGYQQVHLQAVPVRGAPGAFWQFSWTPPGEVRQLSDDILFILPTPAGPQSYALYFRAPDNGWNAKYLPVFEQILRTFQPVPS